MPVFAHGNGVQIHLDAGAALRRHLEGGRGQSGGAHVLDGDDRIGRHQLQAGFDQELFGERVTHLHRRALFLRISENSADAMVAPWMPSRPVLDPT